MDNKPLDWQRVARLVLTSRAIDDLEETRLAPTGQVAYQFSSRGHELAQVLLGLSLNNPHDGAGVYYRSRPFMLACGLTPEESLAANLALSGSPSEGRDVGVVYSMTSRGGATILPSSGDVGAQYTPAAGWAQAIQYHSNYLKDRTWDRAMAVVLGGDGSVASNGFWSALSMATTLKLPLLFFIEDNGYGLSVPRHFQTPGGDIAENLSSFNNLHLLRGSGSQPQEASQLIHEAVTYVRAGKGPCLVRLRVPRLMGHTYGEDQTAYKDSKLIAEERADDPVLHLKMYLQDHMDWPALEVAATRAVESALAAAQAHPDPDPTTATQQLFAPVHEESKQSPSRVALEEGPRINFAEAVRRVMEVELGSNPRLLIFGEDVGLRGGVHRVTAGLQQQFGEARVFDTSLSEEGIVGRAVGMAVAGLLPLPEIQFRKYADPAYEQMHDAGWIRWRTAGKFVVPIVIRIPVGHSKLTGDPWHSVSGEAIFAHTLGWRIAYPSNAGDAAGLLRAALRGQDPTLFLEHRALLDTPAGRRPYPGDGYELPFGKANLVQKGCELTIVSWGEMVHRCVEAAEPYGDDVEILDLRTIIPWDKDAVLNSVEKTGKCLVAHEDTVTAGFGAEIVATLASEAFTVLDAPLIRVATADAPIPYNIGLMNAVIPGVEEIRARIADLLAW
jgi:2-oxoisovalerate dehydrogenase E1 component